MLTAFSCDFWKPDWCQRSCSLLLLEPPCCSAQAEEERSPSSHVTTSSIALSCPARNLLFRGTVVLTPETNLQTLSPEWNFLCKLFSAFGPLLFFEYGNCYWTAILCFGSEFCAPGFVLLRIVLLVLCAKLLWGFFFFPSIKQIPHLFAAVLYVEAKSLFRESIFWTGPVSVIPLLFHALFWYF